MAFRNCGSIEGRKKILGKDFSLKELVDRYDAVFSNWSIWGNDLEVDKGGVPNIRDAVDFISDLRQTTKIEDLPVGREVIVVFRW